MGASHRLVLVVAISLIVANAINIESRPGDASQEREVDSKVRQMVRMFEPTIRALYPSQLSTIEPLSYKTQLVSGTNYLVKAKVTNTNGHESIIHLRLWETLFGGVKFGAIRTRVNGQTPLTSFMESDV